MGASTGSTTGGAQDPTSTANLANMGASIASSAALGPVGIGLAVAGSTLSFIQASKQMQLQRQAEQDAQKAFEEAKRQININPYDTLAIQKEPYELEREALLSQGAQAIQAGQEADRGAAATAGRIQMAQNEAQAGQRTAMGKELSDLAKLSADEDANIKTQLASLDLAQAQGYQTQAKEAAKTRANAIEQAYQSGAKALEYGVKEMPLILGWGKGGGNADNQGQVSPAPVAKQAPSGNQQVPSSKLNTSTFQTMPSWQSLAEQQMYNNSNFNQGSKLGPGIQMPNWSDAYNYFKF